MRRNLEGSNGWGKWPLGCLTREVTNRALYVCVWLCLWMVGGYERLGCGSGRPDCRKALGTAPSQSSWALGETTRLQLNSCCSCSQSCWVCILWFPWQPPIASLPQCQDCSTPGLHWQGCRALLSASSEGLWSLKHLYLPGRFMLHSQMLTVNSFLMIKFYWILL